MAPGGERRQRAGDSNQPEGRCCRSYWRRRPSDVAPHRKSTATVSIVDLQPPLPINLQLSSRRPTTKADGQSNAVQALLLVLTDWRTSWLIAGRLASSTPTGTAHDWSSEIRRSAMRRCTDLTIPRTDTEAETLDNSTVAGGRAERVNSWPARLVSDPE